MKLFVGKQVYYYYVDPNTGQLVGPLVAFVTMVTGTMVSLNYMREGYMEGARHIELGDASKGMDRWWEEMPLDQA